MKKTSFVLCVFFSLAGCKESSKEVKEENQSLNQQPVNLSAALEDSVNFTTIEWLDSTYQELGKVEEGQVVDIAFRLKNSGSKPLILPSVSVGCGCTTISERPLKPLMPGEEGIIKAKFDSKNMAGDRLKEIYVRANTMKTTFHTIYFHVDVAKK